jgi:uncharacterized membrane protein YidH (DUF202 family)
MEEQKNNENIPDSELLAYLRTLFALERNYLAEERTILAKFRTGVALALFVPSLYIYSVALNWTLNLYLLIFFYLFLILCAIEGGRLIIVARFELKRCRRLKNSVISRESDIINKSKLIKEAFDHLVNNVKPNGLAKILKKQKKLENFSNINL